MIRIPEQRTDSPRLFDSLQSSEHRAGWHAGTPAAGCALCLAELRQTMCACGVPGCSGI